MYTGTYEKHLKALYFSLRSDSVKNLDFISTDRRTNETLSA